MPRIRLLAGAVVFVLALAPVRAETIDWSQYIEKKSPAAATPKPAAGAIRAKHASAPAKTKPRAIARRRK